MEYKIEYVKVKPTQNMTILVLSEVFENKQNIASQLMSYQSVHAEQVAYIRQPNTSTSDAQLEMSGGEFCGNACMALATYLVKEKLNKNQTLLLEVSRTDQVIKCSVNQKVDGYWCEVSMPSPYRIHSYQINHLEKEWSGTLVHYSDAVHFILEIKDWTQSEVESLTIYLHGQFPKSVVGILLYNIDTQVMYPVIYVSKVGSLVWEKGCGSGTGSIGAYLSDKFQRDVSVGVQQPEGVIEVTTHYEKTHMTALSIKGKGEIFAKGTAIISK